MIYMPEGTRPLRAQQGVVLFVSLIILVLLSLFALASANTSILERKMVTAMRNGELARLAAESALSDAKRQIENVKRSSGPSAVCKSLLCFTRPADWPQDPASIRLSDLEEFPRNEIGAAYAALLDEENMVQPNARSGFLIEDLGLLLLSPARESDEEAAAHVYRVTAVGYGSAPGYLCVLEEVIHVSS